MIRSYKYLEVYKLSYDFAMEIIFRTRKFLKENLYSLTSQQMKPKTG